jgi:hypothetical protein
MYLDLSGIWTVTCECDGEMKNGEIRLPGILQSQGYGDKITPNTKWVSSLHDSHWYEREEYRYYENMVPHLSQPPRHFVGKAVYEKKISIADIVENDDLYLVIENTRWRTCVYVDNIRTGKDCSLCTPHRLYLGKLGSGEHIIKVEIDNSMQYPYRPDGHSVSDALGATWNGMVGEIAILSLSELENRKKAKLEYAASHPRHIEVKNGKFYVDGKPEYFRGTHFGGDYPLTGYPETNRDWWLEKMGVIKSWGINFIRCHSYCPPETAFMVADELGIYIQVECGMWNRFEDGEDGREMNEVLWSETRRILDEYGHHPSFVLFSPTNEPSGDWYKVLRDWVSKTREYDKLIGYSGRRVYTAESGWFYDVEPSKVEGTDYMYFHRSNYGPYLGGTIRNHYGWKGKDYSPSLIGAKLPVISHELGQWCSYPDFDKEIEKFTGYMIPGNLMQFRENCRENGLLPKVAQMAYASGRNQLRLYKEDIEATLRTKEIEGFELLDLHDYMGQGTALVGLLDTFWEEKGYAQPEEFRQFCDETVLLARFKSYVYRITEDFEEKVSIPIEVYHYGKEPIENVVVKWSIIDANGNKILSCGEIPCNIVNGGNTKLGNVEIDFRGLGISENKKLIFKLELLDYMNQWELYIYTKSQKPILESDLKKSDVIYTKSWDEAKKSLKNGKTVIYTPYLSDLGYECPSLSMKNVFWNGLMGPTWSRELGLLIDDGCGLFKDFPTDISGGWQWEDILNHARGFCLPNVEPIVRVIDDWNRNLPLSLITMTNVDKGRLILVSADLEGDFEKRPAAYSLKNALFRYALSGIWNENVNRITFDQIEQSLFPVLRMEQLTEKVLVDGICDSRELVTANPNSSLSIRTKTLPVKITIAFKKKIDIKGIIYIPEQRERMRDCYPKDCEIVEAGMDIVLHNNSRSQRIMFDTPIYTDTLSIVIKSTYGDWNAPIWKENSKGYYIGESDGIINVEIAGIQIVCDEKAPHSDILFWNGEQMSTTKEIDA